MLTSRLSRLLVTLPIMVVPIYAVAIGPAFSAGAADEAVRILTRARVADQKCNYLSSSERHELSRYTARAEIAAASQTSPQSAKAAASAGKADGNSQNCSPELNADVRETLSAAREAIAETDAAPEPEQKASADNSGRTGRKFLFTTADDGPPLRVTGGNLGRYSKVVKAYYLERKCRSLARGEAKRFWKGIVLLHRETVKNNGVRAVARVMQAAESGARGSPCGGNVEAQIRKGYTEILSR
jgi:hypothetical protein